MSWIDLEKSKERPKICETVLLAIILEPYEFFSYSTGHLSHKKNNEWWIHDPELRKGKVYFFKHIEEI